MDHFHNSSVFDENYFTYPQLYSEIVKTFPDGSHFVEIGSWKGRSAAFMAVEIINSGKNIRFDCVDTWKGSEEHVNISDVINDTLYERFLSNIEPVKHIITPVRMDSVAALGQYPDASLDFVFIDGDHSYEGVRRDIIAALPKMKFGSILAGHDWHHQPIKQAVFELFGHGKEYADQYGNDCWVVRCA